MGQINVATKQQCRDNRRGAIMGVMALIFPVLVMLAAFAINSAHMQLTRTQLMVATEAAARAGGRAFSETQSVDSGIQAAAATAAMNVVNGEPLALKTGDNDGEIIFGIGVQPGDVLARYEFQPLSTAAVRGGLTASAFKVIGNRTNNSLNNPVPVILPGLLGINEFEVSWPSVAMQVDRDISLVLDRSGSMDDLELPWEPGQDPFSNSAINWAVDQGMVNRSRNGNSGSYRYYYADGYDSVSYQQAVYEDYYENGMAPRNAWQDLVVAVDAFLDILDETPQEEQVSLASYSTAASLDNLLEKDLNRIRRVVHRLNTGGRTAIGQGMNQGIRALADARARPYAAKTMVVMTDGMENEAPWAGPIAQRLIAEIPMVIHTVTFGPNADTRAMRNVATVGGGKHYHAATGADLVRIFQEIANNLPTILTQ